MKLEIYNEAEDTQTLRIKLEKTSDGIEVIGVDSNGNRWYIVTLRNDGRLGRIEGLDEALGFQVDKDGRIISTDD